MADGEGGGITSSEGSSGRHSTLSIVAISAVTSVVVTGVILYVAMRRPLPLIDTATSAAPLTAANSTTNQQVAA